MKFKYKLAYKVDSKGSKELVQKLKELGYVWNSVANDDWKYYPYIRTGYNNRLDGIGYSQAENHVINGTEIIDNEDLFLALASMRDDDKFYPGEYVYCNKPDFCKNNTSRLFKIKSISRDKYLYVESDYTDANWNVKVFRKATKEEIESLFSSKVQVKDDHDSWEIGDHIIVSGSTEYRLDKGVRGDISITVIKDGDLGQNYDYYSNKQVTRFIKEGNWKLIKKNKQVDSTNFVVTGSKHLRLALVNELVELGLEKSGSSRYGSSDIDLLVYNNRIGAVDVGSCITKGYKKYILPQDYELAKEAFLQTLSKLTEVKLTITTDNGSHELRITKDKVYSKGHSFNIEGVKSLKEQLDASGYSIRIIFKVDIGCEGQIKGVTVEHINSILEVHSKLK